MNPKVQIKKLKDQIDWLLGQTLSTEQTQNAIMAVAEISRMTDVLSTFGDYFAYTQNIMISEVQLQLAKLYVEDQDSHSLAKIIRVANDLFTEEYYRTTGINQHRRYEVLKDKLIHIQNELNDLQEPISNLKKLRNKNLAHFDKSISNNKSLDNLENSNPLYLSDINKLINFALSSLKTIKAIMFGNCVIYNERTYTHELNQIAKAIDEYRNKRMRENV